MRAPHRNRGRIAWLSVVACLAVAGGTGCSATTDEAQVRTVTVEKPAEPASPESKPRKRETAPRPPAEFKACDANIEVKAATTTCEFAQNVFWQYWTDGQGSSLSVYSPAVGATLTTSCEANAGRVVCTTADRGAVRFTQAAVDSYSADQAATYAGSHDLGPAAEPDEEAGDPYADSASPDTGEPGEEIPNYDEGRGYRVQCEDGMYSKSGGIQGACSGHGGVLD